MKRFLKYLGRIIGAIFILLLLIVFLLYLPPVQHFVAQKVIHYVSARSGLVIQVEKFRLGFPLNVKLENVYAGRSATDTLLFAQSLRLDIGLRKIFLKEISVDDLDFRQLQLGLKNDTTGMQLQVGVGELNLKAKSVNLSGKKVVVDFINMASGEVHLTPGKPVLEDTTVSNPVDWSFEIGRIHLKKIAYRMEKDSLPFLGAGLGEGLVTGGNVILGKQTVGIDSVFLDGGWCHLLTGGTTGAEEQDSAVADTVSLPWTIQAKAVRLQNSAFQLENAKKPATKIILAGIAIQLDSVYNRGSAIKAAIRDLQAIQRDGIDLVAMRANVDLDTTVTALHGMYLQTSHSWLRMEAQADTSVQHLMEKVPLTVNLNGSIGLLDIAPFYGHIPVPVRQKAVRVNASFAVSGKRFQLGQLILNMPGHFRLTGSGRATAYQNIPRLQGQLDIRGELEDITFMQNYLRGAGVCIPRNLSFTAAVKAERGNFIVSAGLECEQGVMNLSGDYQMESEQYQGDLELNRFPLERFLPQDSLGKISGNLHLEGKGFSWQKAKAEMVAEIRDFTFRRHNYTDIELQLSLNKTRLRGTLTSKDPEVPLEFIFRGDSVAQAYRMEMMGSIKEVDLQALHFVTEPFKVATGLQVQAEIAPESIYSFNLLLDSLQVTDRQRNYLLGHLKLDMQSDARRINLNLVSGDLNLKFRADTALMDFVTQVGKVGQILQKQVTERNVNMNLVKEELPPFSLQITGGRENVIAGFLKFRNIGYRKIYFDAVARKRQGLRVGFEAEAPYYGKIRLDSLHFGAWQTGKSLAYNFNAGSSAENWKGLFNINLAGRIQADQLRVELQQKNNKGQIGFDLGMNLTMQDSAFSVSFFPVNPILGYSRWIVNADNRITVTKDLKINADLRMAYQNKLVSIRSLGTKEDMKDRLQIEIQGIDLGRLTKMVPFMPDLAGEMNTDLLLYSRDNAMGVDGNIQLRNLFYEQQRIGTLGLGMQYAGKNRFTEHAVNFELKIDSIRRAVVQGTFFTSESRRDLQVDVDIPSFPLYVINAFMPPDIMKLGGELHGKMQLRGTVDKPLLNGELAFREGKANLLMLGTTFSMDTKPLVVEDGKVIFRQYRFIAPNNSDMILNGDIKLVPFDLVGMDLSVKANNFEVVNVKKNSASLIYGKAYTDINTRIAGTFSDLNVSGNVNLLNRTAIVYTLRNAGPQLVDHSEDLVRFVSFRDTTLNEADDLTNRVKAGSFSLRLLIEIGNQVSATVALSEDGNNNVSIQGGGNLVLVMNPESGMTLTGKYIISGGTVVYNVPIAGKKEFNIQSGSYVEWSGNLANPILNISASESVKATVEDGERNRLVTFESIIRIQNTLNQPDITFDLSAPNDMVIQNQLATFSKEERTRQALNLMIYNTYTAPGAAKSGGGSNVANNALYSFVENELNKYTRKVGLTVGMDSYNTDENNVRTDVTYQFSKQFFNDRVRIKIGGRISTDNNDNPGNSGNLQDNLVDDISIEYVLTRRRNLFLKVFRHSNYESVLDGEVTQTGVGIVWRKDFRKFKELFKNKNREERRKLKREAKMEQPGKE